MGLNTKEFAVKFTGELDRILCEKSAVGFMTDNALRSKFIGAKSVKMPQLDLEGLGDYDRETGFSNGCVKVTNSVYEMKQDRARSFSIDREDMDEAGIAELAGSVMSEFVRTKVVPETDAYVISKLAGVSYNRSQVIEGDVTKPFECFSKLLAEVQSAAGFDEELVCFVNPAIWNGFRMSNEFTKYITLGDFKQGKINTQVHYIDNIAVIPVSAARMQSAYEFLSGKDAQSMGGFRPASGAKGIYMLMLPKKAASLVRKNETIRTFSPEANPDADAYKFDYRLYYDVFVKSSYLSSIWAMVAPAITVSADLSGSKTVTAGSISGKLSVTASTADSGTVKYQWYSCDDSSKKNAVKLSGENTNSLTLDTALTKGKYYYFVRMSVSDATVVDSNVCCVSVE